MSARKGARNAAGHQAELMAPILRNLETEIRKVRQAGLQFKTVSGLSEYLGPLVAVSPGRLRRNRRYREKLDQMLSSQPGAVSIVSRRSQTNAIIAARLIATELELSRERGEKDRLMKLVAKHLPGLQAGTAFSASSDEDDQARELLDLRHAFNATSEVLVMLLERVADLGFAIDVEAKSIIDRSARPGARIVASSPRTKWFIDWFTARKR